VAKKGNIELIKVLLVTRADVNTPLAYDSGVTALQASIIKGYIRITLMLLDTGVDINVRASLIRGRTALEGATEHGHIDMV
jgi:ankyrin repeat protein